METDESCLFEMGDKMIKISVIIPVYNAGESIKECIESIQKQTLNAMEIICVDDGSTDDSLQILKDMRKADGRICILEQQNQGAGKARNLALQNATGEFVCFVDADDTLIDKSALEQLYMAALEQGVMVCGGQMYQEENGEIKYKNIYGNLYQEGEGGKRLHYSDYQYDYHYQNFIYSRDMLMRNLIDFPDFRRYQDPPFFVKAMVTAGDFYVLNVSFYCYHISTNKRTFSDAQICDWLRGVTEVLRLSVKYKLRILHRREYFRICESWGNIYIENVLNGNIELLKLLIELNSVVEWDWVEEECKIEERILKPLLFLLQEVKENRSAIDFNNKYKWKMPNQLLEKKAEIVLYGAGQVGSCYFEQIMENGCHNLRAWVDNNYLQCKEKEMEIRSEERRVGKEC